jgi:hypothetical protein
MTMEYNVIQNTLGDQSQVRQEWGGINCVNCMLR